MALARVVGWSWRWRATVAFVLDDPKTVLGLPEVQLDCYPVQAAPSVYRV